MPPITVSDTGFAGFAQDVLYHSWGQGDFTIVVEEHGKGPQADITRTVFKVSSIILGRASPVLEQMVRPDSFVEGATSQVTIKDFSAATVEAFLRFLHFGSVEGSLGEVLELARLSDKYAVDQLHKLCTKAAKKKLNRKSACRVFELADRFQNAELRRHALELILFFPKKALKSRPSLSVHLVHEILASEALCLNGSDLLELMSGWGGGQELTPEELGTERLFKAYAMGEIHAYRRRATGDCLYALRYDDRDPCDTDHFGFSSHVAVLCGPAGKDWRSITKAIDIMDIAHNKVARCRQNDIRTPLPDPF